ncbi:hypothetical protein FB45DRAFT_1038873 [Roridomyces roridus]|uniref:Uncharacterized protein n=1 Tax=Roridomyces roridus TaxID=1738132 RepID=A0AAD7B415_9AGAR|nr:hypothetical protein FB45DRAFT_1038873 [Roridomyces roridus]
MSRATVPSLRTTCIYFTLPLAFFAAALISSFMPATNSLTPMLLSVADKLYNGVAVTICIVLVCTLCKDFMGASKTDGVAPGTAPQLNSNTVDTSGSDSPGASQTTSDRAVALFFTGLITISYIVFHPGIISLDKSVAQNVLDFFVVFLLQGLEVNLLVFAVFAGVAKCTLVMSEAPDPGLELPTVAVAPVPSQPLAVGNVGRLEEA